MAATDLIGTGVTPDDEGAAVVEGGDQTPARLIEAAEKLFAEKGYVATSVRDITQVAGCNVASVNYHFGAKYELYLRVFERIIDELVRHRLEAIAAVVDEAEREGDLELVLRAFAESFYRPLLEPGRGPRLFMIFMRELTDKHLDPGVFVEKLARPIEGALVGALMRVAPDLGEVKAGVCFRLFEGQLVHLVQMWTMAGRMGDGELGPFDVGEMVDHIVKFTSGGIGAFQNELGSEGKR